MSCWRAWPSPNFSHCTSIEFFCVRLPKLDLWLGHVWVIQLEQTGISSKGGGKTQVELKLMKLALSWKANKFYASFIKKTHKATLWYLRSQQMSYQNRYKISKVAVHGHLKYQLQPWPWIKYWALKQLMKAKKLYLLPHHISQYEWDKWYF